MAYRQPVLGTGTAFHLEDNGVWTLAHCTKDAKLDLCYIKTRNTDSGKIDVHYTTGKSTFQDPVVHSTTAILADNNANGTFLMQDFTGDGIADLVFIRTRNTAKGFVEIYVLSAKSGYTEVLKHAVTKFPQENNGTWFMSDEKDLVYIKTENTESNKVEVHIMSHKSNYTEFVVHQSSNFGVEDNGTWTLSPHSDPSYPDLYYIKTRNTPSNTVEVYADSAASQWQERILDSLGSKFATEDNGYWMVADWTHQEFADLVYIKTRNTGTGTVEVHINEYMPPAPKS